MFLRWHALQGESSRRQLRACATPMEATSGTPEAVSKRAYDPKTNSLHLRKMVCGRYHYGLVHRSISVQEAMRIPAANAAVGNALEILKMIAGLGRQENETQDRSCSTFEERWKNSPRRESDRTNVN